MWAPRAVGADFVQAARKMWMRIWKLHGERGGLEISDRCYIYMVVSWAYNVDGSDEELMKA